MFPKMFHLSPRGGVQTESEKQIHRENDYIPRYRAGVCGIRSEMGTDTLYEGHEAMLMHDLTVPESTWAIQVEHEMAVGVCGRR